MEGVKTGITRTAGGCLATRLRRLGPGPRPARGRSREGTTHVSDADATTDFAVLNFVVLGCATKLARFTDTSVLVSHCLAELGL